MAYNWIMCNMASVLYVVVWLSCYLPSFIFAMVNEKNAGFATVLDKTRPCGCSLSKLMRILSEAEPPNWTIGKSLVTIITGSYHITLYTRIKNTPIPFRTKMLGCEKYPAHVIGYELKTYSNFIPSTSYPPVITTSYHPFSTSYPPATGYFCDPFGFTLFLDPAGKPYPLVMTDSSPWYRWPIEIDGLPINSMVIFHGELLKITRWYYFFN